LKEGDVRTRRRAGRQTTVDALRGAAMRIFAAKGYDAATTRAVADAAGVNEQLIQRYFGGKAGLLRSIFSDYAERDRAGDFGEPPIGHDIEEEIANVLMFNVERERRYGDFARVAIYRAIVDKRVAAEIARMFVESREPFVLARLTLHAAGGGLRSDADLAALAHLLSSLSFAFAFTDQLVLRRPADVIKRTIAETARTIARGLAPQT
jgi:AcrR family transcriptional regulator